MLRNKFVTLFKNFSRSSLANPRQLGTQAKLTDDKSGISTMNLSLTLEEKMKAMHHQQQQQSLKGNKISIYRVPQKLRKVEPRAYDPQFISIGPFHHGLPSLQASEKLKLESLNRLVGSGEGTRDEIDKLLTAITAIEQEARGCYSEDVELCRDEFVKIMLLDCCFIVELLRDLKQSNFAYSSLLSKRWMLPVVRRDLITLENQIPMIVLKKIYDKTRTKSTDDSLEELALRFFDPLMPREDHILRYSIECSTKSVNGCNQNFEHLLDLFHSSISPREMRRGKEPHMYRSVTELKEAGIKVRVSANAQPLELSFEGGLGGLLRIPRLQIDDHSGSFFRNIVAYEQCHQDCKPDMTTYLFFLDKLINSAEDVGLLHYGGVIQHSLGSNKQLAKLVNILCLEVEHDGQDSYLCEVVESLNFYCNRWWVKSKARLKHDYFSNLWVGLSTLAALLLLYLTLVQTTCDVIGAQEGKSEEEKGWWRVVNLYLVDPVTEFKSIAGSASSSLADSIAPEDPPPDGPKQCI